MGVWSSAIEAPVPTRLCDRAGHARAALTAHAAASGHDDLDPAAPDATIHLLCDLMHLSMAAGTDFAALLGAAEHHFLEERILDQVPTAPPAPARC